MKAILVIDSISRAGGGLFDAERRLHQELAQQAVATTVYALTDAYAEGDLPTWDPMVPKVFSHQGPPALGFSSQLRAELLNTEADLIYRAGLWRLPSKYAYDWRRKYRKPEIIAPHGMLDPWAVRNSRWKKQIAGFWFEKAHLCDAGVIRALCASEAQSILAYGLNNAVCIIPNGVDLPEVKDRSQDLGDRTKILLFLGRIHSKKGLVNALRAWGKVRDHEEWKFMIAGWDQGGHEAELKHLCDELGLMYADIPAASFAASGHPPGGSEASVVFTGPAFGEAKDQLLRSATAFILASFSEGLPMSVLEAWSYQLPVLMTDHCNLPEGFAANAALRIGTDAESIAQGMSQLIATPISDLRSLGTNGRTLVERQFTWPQVAAQMKEVYEWVLGGGAKPACVVV